jgi:superfamily II DNA or RNA helicase
MYHKRGKDGERIWDGYVKYISEATGVFKTGLIHQLVEHMEKIGIKKYTIEDKRDMFKFKELPEGLGGLKFRKYQRESINSILTNEFNGFKFQRGILAEATNAGKSLIAGGIFASFANKRTGFFLVNSTTLFTQALADLEALLPGEVGQVSSKKTELKRINVCMVQTLGNRLKSDPKYKNALAKADIVIVDEADEVVGRKDVKLILATAYNATVRVALSGTPLMHKDPTRNQELVAYFGPIVHKTTNKELVEEGVSTPPDIRMYLGSTEVRMYRDYAGEYRKGIMKNRKRHKRIWRLVKKFQKKTPMLILFKEHAHAYSLIKYKPEELSHLTTEIVHGETKGREAIFKRFNEGKIDVLIASMIIRRGKNLPRIKVLINAAGGTSEANVLQILGRALRSHKSKKKVYVLDFYDEGGAYICKHSKRRLRFYQKQKFEVKTPYKKQLKKLAIK